MSRPRLVLLAAALLFAWFTWGNDLWAPDEPYFAEGAREMLVDGQWAVPHVNGVVTNDKPPLFFWLVALFSLPLGQVTSFTARLPSVLAGVGTVALTLHLGRRFASERTAALAGVILATASMFVEQSRSCRIDALLCLLIWTALAAFQGFRSGDADGRRAGLLFWLAAALATVAKGPVGLLLPLGIALTVLVTDGELRRWRRFAPWAGPLLFVLVVGAWAVLATIGGKGEYSVWGSLQQHFISRGIHGLHHRSPPWHYLQVMPANLLPWTGLLPGALLLAWRRRSSADRFLLAAALFVVVFFSISTEKRGLYVLPAFPALALLMANLVAGASGWDEGEATAPRVDRRWATVGQGTIGGVLLLVGLAAPLAARRYSAAPMPAILGLAAILVATGAATLLFARRGSALGAVLATAAGITVVYLVIVTWVLPAFDPVKSGRAFALRIKEVTAASRAAGLPVLAYDLGNLPEPFSFYSDGVYTVETADPQRLARHLERGEAVFAAVDGAKLGFLPPALCQGLVVVDSTVLSRIEVLLISNAPHPGGRPLSCSGGSAPGGG